MESLCAGGRCGEVLSGPISRDTAILSLRYPHIARYLLTVVSTPPKWCDTPWHLVHIGTSVRCPILQRIARSPIIVRYLILGSVFGRTDFSADFHFWAAGLFRGFSRRMFSHFCGTECPEKSFRKSPAKSSKIYRAKNPRHISAERPGQIIKTSTEEFRDAIATGIARYEKYRCWASKVRSARGLLK